MKKYVVFISTICILFIVSSMAHAKCTAKQIEKMIDSEFSKSEIQELCGGKSKGRDYYDNEESEEPTSRSRRSLPKYCCTRAGRLGPYSNDTVKEGEPCYGTTQLGQAAYGDACY